MPAGTEAFTYTGQRASDIGLYFYNARWMDSSIGHFTSADTIIPDPMDPASYDRYSYSSNNPINYNDPTGHWPDLPNPYPIIQNAINFFTNLGYAVVGNPLVKSINANGPDIVFQKLDEGEKVIETLCVECKDVANSVNLGTLGKNVSGDYGGSLNQVLSTADRLANTSNAQLQEEFEAVRQGQAAGNLTNALYTTAGKVSEQAQNVFNYVYAGAANATAVTLKTIQTIGSNTVDIFPLMVPSELIDPKNSPEYNPSVNQ